MNDIEERIARASTAALIEQDAVSIVLERPQYVSDGAGGRRLAGYDTMKAQEFRIVEESAVAGLPTITVDGEQYPVAFWLLGSHDANIQDGDTFMHNTRRMKVGKVLQDRRWRVQAGVI